MALRLPRLIPRLDIKGANVVKGIQMEGLRVVGNPAELAERYAHDADELLYVDTVASLYGRNHLHGLLERATAQVFIPVTVAGGIRSDEDVRSLLAAGADKVAINTAAHRDPSLIDRLAHRYGSQAIVTSIEAKRTAPGVWECFTDNGREKTGRDARKWALESVARGSGEILLTSVDQEGTRRGFDVELLEAVAAYLPVPVVICGGMGNLGHLQPVRDLAHGIAMASVLHYGQLTISQMREALGLTGGSSSPAASAQDRQSAAA